MLRNNSKNFLFTSQSQTATSKGPALLEKPVAKPDAQANGPATAATSSAANTPTPNPLRLFVNQTIFLDLNESCKQLSKVKECLKLIGARIADCLSKEVKYVITNRDKLIPLNDSTNPSSPHNVANHHDTPEPAKKLKTSPSALSFSSRGSFGRAQSVMEKASKSFKSIDVLTTAHRLGISVMSLNDIERYVDKYLQKKKSLEDPDSNKTDTNNISLNLITEQKRSNLTKEDLDHPNHKICRLKNPFLKFEPICKQYRPTYQEFRVWHDINFETISSKGTNSPFQAYFSDDVKNDNGESTSSAAQNGGDSQGESQSAKPSFTRRPSQSQFKSPQSSNQNTLTNQKATSNLQSTGSTSNMFKSVSKTPANTNPGPYGSLVNTGNINSRLVMNAPPKKKTTGYCECCKQRFDNLKQHLTSAQHDNFDKNLSNFKEIDEFINGSLNFKAFIDKRFPPNTRVSQSENTFKGESSDETASLRSEKQHSSSLSTVRGGKGKATPRPSLNTTEFPTMDTSYMNQEAILEAFNDFTYEIIDQNK